MSNDMSGTHPEHTAEPAMADNVTTTSRRRWDWNEADTSIGENVMPFRNRVQWGPIVAGILSAITVMVILSVLGLAVGSTALEPRDAGESLGTSAAIWGCISAIIAFFIGGWIAAKTAAVGGVGSGIINGLMVGCAILVILLWLATTGVSSLIGTLGSNIGDIINVIGNQGVTVNEAQQQAQQTIDAQAAFNTVQDAAWGTSVGIILPLIAAALGGWLGHNKRRDLIEGTR